MIGKKEKQGTKILEMGLVFFLCGIYIMPVKIKIFSVFYVGSMILFYLIFNNGRFRLFKENILWFVYCLLGLFGTFIWGIGDISVALEFAISVGMGILASSMCMSVFLCESQIKSLRIIVFIVLLGCLLQMLAPDLLVNINRITLGDEQFRMFFDFLSWKHMVGFSYQTGVTAHYLCVFEMLLISKYLSTEKNNRGKKSVYVILFCLGIILVLLTEKRSSLLALFCVAFVMIVIFCRKHIINILMAGAGLGVITGLVLFCTDAGLRMLNRTFGENPFTGRLKIYRILLEMVRKHPLMGNGFGSTRTNVTEFTNGHNIYLQTLAEVGLIGLIILLSILVGNLLRSIRLLVYKINMQKVSFVEVFCLEYQLYFIVVGFMGNVLYDVFPFIMYMLTSGVIYSMKEELIKRKI